MSSRVKGELKIEFYAHIKEIKDLYFNQGVVVFKILHQRIVKKYRLTISYKMFCYYAKKELKGEIKPLLSSKENKNNHKDIKRDDDEPIIAYPSFHKVKKFVPYNEGDS